MEYFVQAKRNEQGRHELHTVGCENVSPALEPVALGDFENVEDAAGEAKKFLYLPLTACVCCGIELEIDGTPSHVKETEMTGNF